MRRRLTVAILLLVAATLLVTSAGSYYLIRRAAISTAQQELNGEAAAISRTISQGTFPTKVSFQRELKIIGSAGAFAGIRLVEMSPDGSIPSTLPSGLQLAQLDIRALQAGDQTAGSTSQLLVFTAIPTPITGVTATTPVLVITRKVHNPANGLRYFGLIGAVALVVAAAVAAGLARRLTRPLLAAVAATRRIASGDLDATVSVSPHEDPEFTQLAESINTMGANLGRARDQERQFLLSVSHELRTPLTSIRGYAEAVVDGAADDPVAAAVVISSEARRLQRLVQDLLDLASLDADRFSLDLVIVDCSDVARRAIEGFRPRAAELRLDLVTAAVSRDPLWVQADSDRLGQIVANLIENALSFAESRIVVGSGSVGGSTVVWVADDGPGIAADALAQVFNRHYTSDRAGGRRKGSGLGLAIVAELSAAMGATVRAESPVVDGKGTRMMVRFTPVAHGPNASRDQKGSS
jgi:signal transduction histidine kinase